MAQVLEVMKTAQGSAAEKVAFFEFQVAQAQVAAGNMLNAPLLRGTDGSYMYAADLGKAFVISPTGQMYIGFLKNTDQFITEMGGLVTPIYSALIVWK